MPNEAQRKYIFDLVGYRPTPEQEAIHASPARIKLVAGGERAGKSLVAEKEGLSRFYEGTLYWLVAADYERTRAEFTYFCNDFARMGIPYEATKQLDPGEIRLPGGIRIATKSAKDPRKIAMEAPDGIIVCEASQIDFETYLRLLGRAAEKRAWIILSGTFESSLGWYPEYFTRYQLPNEDGAQSFSLPSWSNTFVFPGGRDDPEIKRLERMMPKDMFMERFGGVPCPPAGRVFPEFSLAIHVGMGGLYDYDPSLPVYLAVDPGYETAYAVEVVQRRGDHLYVVDEIYEKGLVTSEIIKVVKQRPWGSKVQGGAIDIAGTRHQAMPAPAEVWLKEGSIALQSQSLSIRDGIERFKTFLLVNPVTNQPLLHINAKARGLISELGGCENPITHQTAVYSWKKDASGNVTGDVPIDKNNHAIKALTYLIVQMFGFASGRRRAKVKFI